MTAGTRTDAVAETVADIRTVAAAEWVSPHNGTAAREYNSAVSAEADVLVAAAVAEAEPIVSLAEIAEIYEALDSARHRRDAAARALYGHPTPDPLLTAAGLDAQTWPAVATYPTGGAR